MALYTAEAPSGSLPRKAPLPRKATAGDGGRGKPPAGSRSLALGAGLRWERPAARTGGASTGSTCGQTRGPVSPPGERPRDTGSAAGQRGGAGRGRRRQHAGEAARWRPGTRRDSPCRRGHRRVRRCGGDGAGRVPVDATPRASPEPPGRHSHRTQLSLLRAETRQAARDRAGADSYPGAGRTDPRKCAPAS